LTHYYAQGKTQLYIDGASIPRSRNISERLVPVRFYLNDFDAAPSPVEYRELFFYRSGMCAEEVAALYEGKMLKSSLEIYAPLDGNAAGEAATENRAQSLNTLTVEEQNVVSIQAIDFGNRRVKEISLYSITGQLLYRIPDASPESLDRLPSGLYVLRMKTENGVVFSQKSIIK
ncbi:MAG: T9SS type A sorting domain-containing protein, partial [Bacteroidales bacterium]|jgi:hypothetical protein|nr:T9SS type A sorting domain-containing protein [Bacteroidales bacterium]